MNSKEALKENRIMALCGIAGTITYAIADLFLYLGTNPMDEDKISLWSIPEWRLMTSMWIGVLGSLLMLMGFISLAKVFINAYGKPGRLFILPALICIGGVMYMHFALGVYEPLTYKSAVKAGVSADQIRAINGNAQAYLKPLSLTLGALGYSTEIIILHGILSGRFGLKKRTALYIYGGYILLAFVVVIIAWLSKEWGLTGSLESLMEMTFFIPAALYWKRFSKS